MAARSVGLSRSSSGFSPGSPDQVGGGGALESEIPLVDCDVHILTIPEEVVREKLLPRDRDRDRDRDREVTIPLPGDENPHGRLVSDERIDLREGNRPAITVGHHADPQGVDAETERRMAEYGTAFSGDEPPVGTYDAAVEGEVVVPCV